MMHSCKHTLRFLAFLPLMLALALAAAPCAQAQNLSFEGPTGILITPTAYTVASPANAIGRPSAGFHFLAGGPDMGDFSTVSLTEGFLSRFEIGFTRAIHAAGSEGDDSASRGPYLPSSIFKNDYDIVHAKAVIVPENLHHSLWIPAVAIGGVYRFNDQFDANLNLNMTEGYTSFDAKTSNGDIYIVATKTITQTKRLPVLLSAGIRGTNASLWGITGNSPAFVERAFGAAGVQIAGPKKSLISVNAEVSQQPRHMVVSLFSDEGMPSYITNKFYDVPTSEAYSVRIAPLANRKLTIDAGVLHAGGNISSQLSYEYLDRYWQNLNAKDRFTFGVSYGF